MPEPLYRIVYNATIDDALDVGMRLANKSAVYRRQVRQNIVLAGVVGGAGAVAVAVFYLNEPGPLEVAVSIVAALAFGAVFALIFKRFYLKEIAKQSRKVITEQFQGKATIACELELRSDAVWVRQAGMEMVFPWALCTGVQDNVEDIELNFSPGLCVVRNRDLSSAGERQRFLDTARRLAGK